jgi:hypothetical protein
MLNKLLVLTLLIVSLILVGCWILYKHPTKPLLKNSTGMDKIISAKFVDCEIKINTEEGITKTIGHYCMDDVVNYTNGGTTAPRYILSDSGKYLLYTDISGGVDTALRIYSFQRDHISTFVVWGTSSVLDMVFLPTDKVAILFGYPNIPEEQTLGIYDIPAIYGNFSEAVDPENDYLKLEKYTKTMHIAQVKGDYFDLVISDEKLTLYGGFKTTPVIRGVFDLYSL